MEQPTVGKSCWALISFKEEFFSGNLLSGKCLPIVMEMVHRKRFVWTNFLLSVSWERKNRLEMFQTLPLQQLQNNSI